MFKNPLQKIFYPLVILGIFLCGSNISAEEFKPLPNPHPVNELCNLWTIDQWGDLPHTEFEKKLLSLNLPISRREVTLVAIECYMFASNEKLRKAKLSLEKTRKEILE